MNESFMRFNELRLERYCKKLKKRQINLHKRVEGIKKELFNKVNQLENTNKNTLQEKDARILELKEQIKLQKEEENFYKTKLDRVPNFILKKYIINN